MSIHVRYPGDQFESSSARVARLKRRDAEVIETWRITQAVRREIAARSAVPEWVQNVALFGLAVAGLLIVSMTAYIL